MKKVAILFLVVIFLTSCTSTTDSNLQATDVMEDEQISFYIHYIDLLKYHEHTVDTIYSLYSLNYMTEQGVSIYKTNISEDKTKYYMTIDEAKSLEDINDIKVSNNNQYMAITFNEESGRIATKLQIIKLKDLTSQDNLRDVSNYKLYEYELVDFDEEDEIELDLTNQHIHLIGFTEDGKVLWGAVAARLDITYSFIINMDTGKIDFLKDQESYNKASEKYEVVH